MSRSSPTSPAEEVSKRQRIETAGLKLKAANIIRFNFYTPSTKLSDEFHSMWFTHQIFEHEELEVFQYPDIAINIYVNTITLDSFVVIHHAPSSSRDYQHILEILQPHFIPSKAQFGDFDDFQRYRDEEIITCQPIAPIGSVIRSWSLHDQNFDIRLSTSQTLGALEILQAVEKLAVWYIETADSIDFSDNRFELLIVYQTLTRNIDDKELHSICGYMTLYTFLNPFSGNKLRICQALVSPHMQGKGIGRELILAAYQLAATRDDIVEVTVEDPAEGFSKLRDAVDVELVLTKSDWRGMMDSSEKERIEAAKSLKMKLSQYIFALEALEYMELTRACDTKEFKDEVVDPLRCFRLKVKKQLMKDNTEVKSAPKDRMRAYLDELFSERRERYDQVLRNRRLKELLAV